MLPTLPLAGRKISAILTCFCCLALPLGAQTLPTRLATPKEIRDMLVQFVDVQHKASGIVVGVITKHGQEVIGYGKFDNADDRLPDAETIFEIGSVTKVFTALLLSDMALRGEVNLNDPVSKYLPATVHVPARNGKQITLLDLATHYSALPRMPNNYNPRYSPEQLYDFLSNYTLTRDPGAKYEYSNLGAGLLGHVLALRAGSDYETLLRERITEPLGMKHTAMQLSPEMQTNLISGFSGGNKAPSIEVSALKGAGAIRSNVDDMLIFLAANMGLIETPLRPAMKKMLSVRRAVSPGVQIAMGWHIANGVVCHNGGTNGYHAYVGFEPHRKTGVVVLSNSTEATDDLGVRVLDYPMTAPVEQQVRPPEIVH
jgi:CubicO group peptidase (beta-lactamase class C family)